MTRQQTGGTCSASSTVRTHCAAHAIRVQDIPKHFVCLDTHTHTHAQSRSSINVVLSSHRLTSMVIFTASLGATNEQSKACVERVTDFPALRLFDISLGMSRWAATLQPCFGLKSYPILHCLTFSGICRIPESPPLSWTPATCRATQYHKTTLVSTPPSPSTLQHLTLRAIVCIAVM